MNVDFNVDADHIDIPLKKYNLTGFLFIFLGLLAVGIWLVVSPSTFVDSGVNGYDRYSIRSPIEVFIIGIFFIVIAGPGIVLLLYRLIDSRPGLTINQSGIIDRSTMSATGFIKWDIIKKIASEEDKYPVYYVVYMDKPEEFIKDQHNIFRRRSAAANLKKYGGPVVINAYQLKCDYDELGTFLIDTLNIYKEDSKV